MKKAALYCVPVFLVAVVTALTLAFAQPDFDRPDFPDFGEPEVDKPYEFKLGPDITSSAAEVVIEPGFKAIADDRFAYDFYVNTVRSGTVRDGDKPAEGFRRAENWVTLATLTAREDALDGRRDLLLRFAFDQLSFLIEVGPTRYTGYLGPAVGMRIASFEESSLNGDRNEVNNIPGWPGVTARAIETARSNQWRDPSGSAWFSVSDQGRVYNETYFADFNTADQRNFPGRFQDPLHLTLGLLPEFAADASLKLGETTVARKRFPVAAGAGATIEYEFTYKLERLYGTVAEPTAARFSFTATPVQREHSTEVAGLRTSWTAPDIKDGLLVFDLHKGVPAQVKWAYELSGTVNQQGTDLRNAFSVKVDFTASMRAAAKE